MAEINTQALAVESDDMFLVRGAISTLYVTNGMVNLLTGMQERMTAAGLGVAIADMAGGTASAAMISMYEGEYVQHFGCFVGEKMVIGSFRDVTFKEGDLISVVASKLDEKVDLGHAVVRHLDGRLWMPHSIDRGRYATAKWIAKLMTGISVVGWCFFMLLQLGHPLSKILERGLIMAFGLTYFSVIVGYLGYRSSPEGLYAERILKILGFKNPKSVNLSPYSERSLGIKSDVEGGSIEVYDLRAALTAFQSTRSPEI